MARPPDAGPEPSTGALERAFAALEPHERLVLWQRFVEQLEPAEVAEALGRTPEEVVAIEIAALRRLRAFAERFGG